MLVLSRHKDEKIRIGHDISITIVRIENDKVRIGIAAPRDIAVHREEVYELIHAKETTEGQGLAPATEGLS